MSDAVSLAYRQQEEADFRRARRKLTDRREQMLKYTDKLKEVRNKIEKLRKEETELLAMGWDEALADLIWLRAKIDAFIK